MEATELAGKKSQHEEAILKIIAEENIYSILDIFAFYSGCSRATFYNLDLDKIDSIKEALDNNKIKTKATLKGKWFASENPTLQLALYKTICTDEERKALSMNYTELTGKDGKDIAATQIIVNTEAEHKIIEDILKKE